jgi:trk system potassium uptake protein TrkH
VRDAVFQVVSIQTTTGFCTANFDQWNFFCKAVLIVLMFVGGCGGSTGGGIKVIRIVVAVKVMLAELERAFRPNVVRPVRVGSAMVDDQQRLGILAYILGIIFLFVIGTLLLMGTESSSQIDSITAMTAAVATLNNIGPGLARVGAVENYAWFSDAGKLVMCVLMAVGRLEIFAIVVIFVPRFWRTQ